MKNIWMKYGAGALFVAVLTGIDQLTKQLAVRYLADGPFVIWDGVFELHYSINKGAAFGILQDKRLFFLLSTCVILGAVLFFYSRIPQTKRYLPLHIVCLTILAGALGNFLDRLRLEYVIDFLYFKLINFPIFNVADCYITVSCVVFALLTFFYYGEEEWNLLFQGGKEKNAKI